MRWRWRLWGDDRVLRSQRSFRLPMSRSNTTLPDSTRGGPVEGGERLCLVLIAYPADPSKVGEVAFLDLSREVLGRDGTLRWGRHLPGAFGRTGHLDDPKLSREQWRFSALGDDRWELENVGRLPLFLNRRRVDGCELRGGDILQAGRRVAVMVQRRPEARPVLANGAPRFGEPDEMGMVGEGPASWALRRQVAFLSTRPEHVLILGESGVGKELVANGLYRASSADGPWVSRSAATIPESLADAELFGNLKNYPNPGMPARPGLVGQADGGVLFLDELGELPVPTQARLLRLLDAGEYNRLGEATSRRASLRMLAATNRGVAELKHDLVARFPHRVTVPGLHQRREDIPLLIRACIDTMAQQGALHPFERSGVTVDIDLQVALVSHAYETHVRELAALLWHAFGQTQDGVLRLWADFPECAPSGATSKAARQIRHRDPQELSDEDIVAALERNEGKRSPTWQELELSSRHVLTRLLKKRGLDGH